LTPIAKISETSLTMPAANTAPGIPAIAVHTHPVRVSSRMFVFTPTDDSS
jgi:hypothetical protein